MQKNGFTLIELCIVTLVLGVFSTLSFSRLDKMLHYQDLSHINAQFLGFVRNVQRYAVLTDKDMTLCFQEITPNREWRLYSTSDNTCNLSSFNRETYFKSRSLLQVRRYTQTDKRVIRKPKILTFYASSGRSSANYRLVFEDPDLNEYVGLRITNIGALRLCASDDALSFYQKDEERLACQ